MRNHRLFGVVIAVLLGLSFVHQQPSSPPHDQQQIAGTSFGGAGIALASARVSTHHGPTPLALGEESPIGMPDLAGPAHGLGHSSLGDTGLGDTGLGDTGLGDPQLASTAVPAPVSARWAAEGDEQHIGLLRPAGTRYVRLLFAWMAFEKAHTPPPPAPAPVAAPKPEAPAPVPHHATSGPVAPATSAGGGSVWAGLRRCESDGNYADDTGNGYYGAYQFSLATWHGLGYAGLPSNAAPAVQDRAAEQLEARSGWGQWPACARSLKLT